MHQKRGFAKWYILLLLCTWLNAHLAVAEEIAVIVHVDNDIHTLSLQEVKRMYNNSVIYWPNGHRVKLFDLRTRDPIRRAFSWLVLDQSAADVARERSRIKIRNRAKNPPRVVKRARSIVARVAVDMDALAYVGLKDVTPSVKVIATFVNE